MKLTRFLAFGAMLIASVSAAHARSGEQLRYTDRGSVVFSDELYAPSVEVAVETAFQFGIIGNPNNYEIGTQFLTARWRWGVIDNDSWLRGYNQVYFSLIGEAILEGPENHYFGINVGLRYNFVQPGWRIIPYISGGVGLGILDSHPEIRGAQGQDFTFNILTAVGVSYQVNEQWKVQVGVLYQHLSNGGQSSPNPSLNLLGLQLGITYSF